MPNTQQRQPTDKAAASLQTTALQGKPARGRGRPPKVVAPTPPQFTWASDYESAMYEHCIAAYREDNPDMTPSEQLLLPLLAAEYIKLLRLYQMELASGELVTMARQHPGTMFAKYLDLLAATRKQRVKGGTPEDKGLDITKLWTE